MVCLISLCIKLLFLISTVYQSLPYPVAKGGTRQHREFISTVIATPGAARWLLALPKHSMVDINFCFIGIGSGWGDDSITNDAWPWAGCTCLWVLADHWPRAWPDINFLLNLVMLVVFTELLYWYMNCLLQVSISPRKPRTRLKTSRNAWATLASTSAKTWMRKIQYWNLTLMSWVRVPYTRGVIPKIYI